MSPVFNVRKVFFEAGVKGTSSLALLSLVQVSAFGTMNNAYNVVLKVVFRDVHLGFWTTDVGVGAYEGTCLGAGIAQWLERRTCDRKVAGSSPGGRIFFS